MLGAGLATTIVNLGMCVAGVWVCYACRPFKKYRILGRFWRPDWLLFATAVRDRRADFRHHAAGVRRVRRRGPADGPARHHRACRTPDRHHVRVDPVHGAVRRVDGGDRPRRPCRRPPRHRGHAARWHGGARARRGVHGGDDADRRSGPQRHPAAVSGHRDAGAPTPRCSLPRCCSWSARASSSPTACRPSRPARCAA